MCEQCHNEQDADYEGSSIEAKRRKAIQAIIERHSELGLDSESVTFRFAPKAQEQCVRVNLETSPRYEIHVPSYAAQAMAGSPPLSGIAMAAWIETDRSYAALCGILDITPSHRFGAMFVSESPPLNPAREREHMDVFKFERDIADHHD